MPQSPYPAAYPAGSDPAFTLGTGPAGATPATLAALGRPILHHLDPAFGTLYQETVELLQLAFETGPSPVILQGEAVVGLEAAAASLIGSGDVVLNLVSGMYGRGYGGWARRYAREVIEVEVPYDSAVPAARVAEAFRSRPDITRRQRGALRDALRHRQRPGHDRGCRGGARSAAHRRCGRFVRRHAL